VTRLSLRARAAILLIGVLGVVTAVFAVLDLSAQAVAQASATVLRTQDFDNTNLELRTALADQETGVRGYALARDREFLQPYQTGKALAAAEGLKLRADVPPQAAMDLSRELSAAALWEDWADKRVAGVTAGTDGGGADDVEGKRLFDAFRADWEQLDAFDSVQLAATNRTLSDQVGSQRTLRLVGWLLVIASLVGLGSLIFFQILRPMLAQARVVASLDGSSHALIPGLGRRDEVGKLATALDAFQETLSERVGLARAMADVGGESDLDRVLELSVQRIADLVDADDGTVTLVTGDLRHIVHSKSGLYPPGMLVDGQSPGTTALASANPVEVEAHDLPEGPVREAVLANGVGPILVLPLISGGESVGTLNALRVSSRSHFSRAEIERARFIAPFFATAIKAARLIRDLREANTVKSRFLANMSHELRTPLNAILGFSQVLTAEDFGPLNERQRRYSGHIETSGRRLLDLINDILDLAKVEAGLMQVAPEPMEVAPVVLESRSQVERQADMKGIKLVYRMAPGLWARADPRRVQQVVLNLLSNAVKFTPEGGSVFVVSTDEDEKGVAIAVIDTGIGIPPGEQALVFDEFAQADNQESREQKGTGLGLSLSRKLTELMGGTLTLESEVGRGSRFIITLPKGNPPAPTSAGPVVMVVEDEQRNLEFLTMTLEQAGYRPVPAGGVAQALEVLGRETPAAVLLDIDLPDGVGWSILDAIVKRPLSDQIPVIAVTALDAPPAHYRDKLAGFMTKPINRAQVVELLNTSLAESTAGAGGHRRG
jgi:signal transduction histidine kinase/CheY-like chemotaxis protein/CHASE3 domain sensor protein